MNVNRFFAVEPQNVSSAAFTDQAVKATLATMPGVALRLSCALAPAAISRIDHA